jgi:hypothetical protein
MKNQPTKIYLNIGADGECQDFEVSWSDSRINDDDLCYISVSSVLARIEELIETKEDLRKISEEVFNEQPRKLFLMNANSVIDTRIPKEPKQGTMSEAIKQVINNQLKQETLEEAAYNYTKNKELNKTSHLIGFKEGAKWQQEQYEILLDEYHEYTVDCIEIELKRPLAFKKWLKQFKK